MSFHMLLEKYKDGTATEEERALVEAELEKSEAIADYLAEGLDRDWAAPPPGGGESAPVKEVRRRVNRRLWRVVFLSVALVVALALGVQFVLSPLVGRLYYNPTAMTMGQERGSDVLFDLKLLYELIYPGYQFSCRVTKDRGFGRYDLGVSQWEILTGKEQEYTLDLSANSGGNLSHVPPNFELHNILIRQNGEYIMADSVTEEALEELRLLPPSSYVSAWVSFPAALSPEELAILANLYENQFRNRFSLRWAAVQVTEDPTEAVMGYACVDQIFGSDDAPDRTRYPLINRLDFRRSDRPIAPEQFKGPDGWEEYEGAGFEIHFTSALRYLSDRPQAVEALAAPITIPQFDFTSALGYVEEHGVQVYAALVYASPEALLALYESGGVRFFTLDNVLPSRYAGL